MLITSKKKPRSWSGHAASIGRCQQQASVTTGAALEKTNWSKINEHFQSFCQQGITSVPLVVERKKTGISNIIIDEPTEEAGYIICFHHCCHHCCINNSIEMHFSPISNRRFLTRPRGPSELRPQKEEQNLLDSSRPGDITTCGWARTKSRKQRN